VLRKLRLISISIPRLRLGYQYGQHSARLANHLALVFSLAFPLYFSNSQGRRRRALHRGRLVAVHSH
jgi:hypothetical protein